MEHAPLIGVVMGSKSDYEVLKAAVDLLKEFSFLMKCEWSLPIALLIGFLPTQSKPSHADCA